MSVSDEEQRMLVVLVSLNQIVAPVLREFVKQGMDNHYTFLEEQLKALTPSCSLRTLTYPSHTSDPGLTPLIRPLEFGNINGNFDVHGRDKLMYDYKVINPVDLAKLYLPTYLAKFSGFDKSLDMSAILRLLGVKSPAPIFSSSNPFICIQSIADDVRDNVRNKAAHFDASSWTETFFEECFAKMEALVKSIVLPDAVEKTKLDELCKWKTQGFKLIIQRDVKELLEEFTKPKMDVIHAQLEKQDELLNEMPTTDEVEKMLCKLLQKMPTKNETEKILEERFDALEELLLYVVENVKEVKLVKQVNGAVCEASAQDGSNSVPLLTTNISTGNASSAEICKPKDEESGDEVCEGSSGGITDNCSNSVEVNQVNGACCTCEVIAQGGSSSVPFLTTNTAPWDATSAEICKLSDEEIGDELSEGSSSGISDNCSNSAEEDLPKDPSTFQPYGCPKIEGINPSIVYLKRQPVPFVVSFAGKLPENVKSGTAEFVNLEDVPLKKDGDCLFGRAVPTSPREGVFKVKVYSQDNGFLGETEIVYLDIIEEALAQAIGEPAIMAKFLRAASQVLQENSGEIIGNAQDSSKVGFSSEWKSSLSVQLIQRLVYTAAKVGALWLIKIIFNLPTGRIVFDSYRSRSLLPEYVAMSHGHKEMAQYLQDVTKRFSMTEETSEIQSNNVDWQEIIAAIEATQDQLNEKQSVPKSYLPPLVPHFTGRQKECEEITGHVISKSDRIVSIWGPPGFGKTSVAIAVGHHLHSQGLPVYFLSLRGLQSTADLASKLLSLFRRPAASDQQNQQRPSIDDELSNLFSELSDPITIILDNAEDLFSGGPNEKEDFTHFLEDILRRTEKVKFVITTRESLEFMNVQFQGHQAVRVCPLDVSSSQNLTHELLPRATASDWKRITEIGGHVPLAMKLLCAAISEDDVEPSQSLNDFVMSFESNYIVEMLDNPDYPSNLRLKLLFDSSFQRLSAQEKEALVSLSVLPESFDLTVAAAVLGISQTPVAKKILHNFRRKSLLDSSSKPGSFVMHRIISSFANHWGENEMKETILKSKARLRQLLAQDKPGASTVVPPEILARGPLALEAYDKALSAGKTFDNRVAIMLIGQDRSGKTSLKNSLRGKPFNSDEDSTAGIEVDPSHFKVSAEIWKAEEKDQETNFETSISYEHHAARLIVERLRQIENISKERDPELMQNVSSDVVTTECSDDYDNSASSSSDVPDATTHDPTNDSRPSISSLPSFHVQTSSDPEPSSGSVSGMSDDIATLIEKLLGEVDKVEDKEDLYSELWDFAGQSVYYVTHPLFLTSRAIYLLVNDLSRNPHERAKSVMKQGMFSTSEDSVDFRTNLDYLDFWMSSIASLAIEDEGDQQSPKSEMLPDKLPPVFLVCTHADIPYDGGDPSKLAYKVFGSLQTKPYKPHLYDDVFVVDNTKSGKESECTEVVRLRKEVLDVGKELPQMKEAIPVKWLRYEKVLQDVKNDGHKCISLDSAKQVASEVCDIVDDKQFNTLLNFLHDQRIFIHFDDTPELNRLVVLDPQWLIDVFKGVINIRPYSGKEKKLKQLWCKLEMEGILDEKLLEHVWGPLFLPQETSDSLIAIMEKFSLLCPLPSSDVSCSKEYLVPSMLKSHPPEGIMELIKSVQLPSLFLKFESGLVPPGLFPRLVLQFFHRAKDECMSLEDPHLYHNFARFYSLEENYSVFLLCHSFSIEIVVHKGDSSHDLADGLQSKLSLSPDASFDTYVRAVRRQLGLILESMRKEFFWLRNMKYKVSFICPVCCKGSAVKNCSTHGAKKCEQEECLHFWSESQLCCVNTIFCKKSAVAPNERVQTEQFAPWLLPLKHRHTDDEKDGRNLASAEATEEIALRGEVLESLLSQSCDAKEVVLQMRENMQLEQASLEQPDSETKTLIRCLARKAKDSNRLDVFEHLREITPAGTTGPLLPEHFDVRNIPVSKARELTINLSGGDEWKVVAEALGLTPPEIRFLDNRTLNPFDSALAFIARQRCITVGELYDLLNEHGFPVIADLL